MAIVRTTEIYCMSPYPYVMSLGRRLSEYLLMLCSGVTKLTVKPETLALLNFGETWFKEFRRKKHWQNANKSAHFAWWLYFWKVKVWWFDLDSPSFYSSKFLVLRYHYITLLVVVVQLKNYKRVFEHILDMEKKVDQANKNLVNYLLS